MVKNLIMGTDVVLFDGDGRMMAVYNFFAMRLMRMGRTSKSLQLRVEHVQALEKTVIGVVSNSADSKNNFTSIVTNWYAAL